MFNDNDLCPCARGLIVRDCNCKSRRFVPFTVCTQTTGPTTGEWLGIVMPAPYAIALLRFPQSIRFQRARSSNLLVVALFGCSANGLMHAESTGKSSG